MMKRLLIPLCYIFCLMFSSCNGVENKQNGVFENSKNQNISDDIYIGKWEYHLSESDRILTINNDGTGSLSTISQSASTTAKFSYVNTDNGTVVTWSKFSKETYHVTLTVDGKYMVADNGTNIYVYKKREK